MDANERIEVYPASVDNIAALVGQGGIWTRAMIASALGHKKSSHLIRQIETAYQAGLISRFLGHDGLRPAYFYTTEQELF